jgi:hypothetical protein
LEILDMVEEGDRVAVRWQLTATYDGKPFEQSIMAIYRGAPRSGHFGLKARVSNVWFQPPAAATR